MSIIKIYDIKQFNVTPFKKYSCILKSVDNNLLLPIDNDYVCFLPKNIIMYYDNRVGTYEFKKKYNKKYYFTRLMIANKKYLNNCIEMSFSILNLIKSNKLPPNVKLEILDYLIYIVSNKKCPCCESKL
jgi:hypothetical protein